jgi:hypothetical protein
LLESFQGPHGQNLRGLTDSNRGQYVQIHAAIADDEKCAAVNALAEEIYLPAIKPCFLIVRIHHAALTGSVDRPVDLEQNRPTAGPPSTIFGPHDTPVSRVHACAGGNGLGAILNATIVVSGHNHQRQIFA